MPSQPSAAGGAVEEWPGWGACVAGAEEAESRYQDWFATCVAAGSGVACPACFEHGVGEAFEAGRRVEPAFRVPFIRFSSEGLTLVHPGRRLPRMALRRLSETIAALRPAQLERFAAASKRRPSAAEAWMRIIVSLLLLVAGLAIITAPNAVFGTEFSDGVRQLASGWVGAVVGHWLS